MSEQRSPENDAAMLSGLEVVTCANCGDTIKRNARGTGWVHTDRIGFEDFGRLCDWVPEAEPASGVAPPGVPTSPTVATEGDGGGGRGDA